MLGVVGSWARRSAFALALVSSTTNAAAEEPELVGLLDGARILAPLGAGRALVCGTSCAVFIVASLDASKSHTGAP